MTSVYIIGEIVKSGERSSAEAVSDIPQIKVYKENDSVYKLSAFSKHIPPYIKSDSRLKLTMKGTLSA